MNILLSFRYLTGNDIDMDENLKDQVMNSNEVNFMTDEFKDMAITFKEKGFDAQTVMDDDDLSTYVKMNITDVVNKGIYDFNNKFENDAYLWLDEICSVFIKGEIAYTLEDQDEYVNFSEIKRAIGKLVNIIAKNDDEFDIKEYCDLFYFVYIDIIEKDTPINYYEKK